MKVTQAILTSPLFKEEFLKKWGLKPFNSTKEPTVFFGVFIKLIPKIMSIDAPVICIWIGSDVIHLMQHQKSYKKLALKSNVKHIVLNKRDIFIVENLLMQKVNYVPITPLNYDKFTLTPKGNKVFAYAPERNGYIYSRNLVLKTKKILKAYNIDMILLDNHNLPRWQMKDLYAQSFCNLRLTVHDGLPNTVVEMGLMGRETLCNINFPGCHSWNSINDIIEFVIEQKSNKMIGSEVYIHSKVFDIIDIGNDWMEV